MKHWMQACNFHSAWIKYYLLTYLLTYFMMCRCVRDCGVWEFKSHIPGAVSGLAQDQLQWQGTPVPFSQQADCCGLRIPHTNELASPKDSLSRNIITVFHTERISVSRFSSRDVNNEPVLMKESSWKRRRKLCTPSRVSLLQPGTTFLAKNILPNLVWIVVVILVKSSLWNVNWLGRTRGPTDNISYR